MCLQNVKLDKYMSNEQCLYMIIYGGKNQTIYIIYIYEDPFGAISIDQNDFGPGRNNADTII